MDVLNNFNMCLYTEQNSKKKFTQKCETCKHYVEKALLIRDNYFEGYCKEIANFVTSDWCCDEYKRKQKTIKNK